MITQKLTKKILILLVLGLVLSACALIKPEETEPQETDQVIRMANPAAVYCEGLGYGYESVERDGGMDADCVFPDGERCAQWDFLAGRCGQEMTFCEMQGGTIQADGNIGTCIFSDGSTCNEHQLFSGDCSMGDNPAQDIEEGETEEEVILIVDFITARDYIAEYLAEEYGVESLEPWMEADITSPDAAGVNTFRYVSGPVHITLSAEASASYAALYNVEASNRAMAFWWEGTIALDGTIIGTVVEEDTPEIVNFVSARDHLMEYLAEEYGIEITEPWMETDITDPDSGGVLRFRYVSGMVTVVLSAEATAPYASLYNVQEVSDLTKGFFWVGTITLDGTITEDEVSPPYVILNREDARDAALGFLYDNYDISSPTSWVDEGMSQAGEYKTAQLYSAGSWLVTVEFEPAAPLVSSYNVTVENSTLGLLWEGEITGQGDITQINFVQ